MYKIFKKLFVFIISMIPIYTFFYGLAYFRYSAELSPLQTRVNNLTAQVIDNSGKTVKREIQGKKHLVHIRNVALERIPKLQNITLPYKPSLNLDIWKSFSKKYNRKNMALLENLKDLAIQYKHELAGLNLQNIDLSDVDLTNTRFSMTNLSNANFKKAILTFSSFDGTCLYKANLSDTDLLGTNFANANLCSADLKSSIMLNNEFVLACLVGTDLRDTNLKDIAPSKLIYAKYNSKEISLGDALSRKQLLKLCKGNFIEFSNCVKKLKSAKVKPTQFPSGFDIKKYKKIMIDVSTKKEIKCGSFPK